MNRTFPRFTNALARASILGFVLLVAVSLWIAYVFVRSPYISEVGIARAQPVAFSHQHHVGQLGIDCRYCHTSVETSDFAGLPPTETCMHCHSQIWANSQMLEPVRASWRDDQPIQWTRIHNLPQYAYFNHSIHINKGVGCATCHGRIDKMPLTYQANTLYMQWCLECHRNTEKHLRPQAEIYNMAWQPAEAEQLALGHKLVKQYNIKSAYSLTRCTVCHY